ncbi:MAG: class I SAM-dependent methyltransferase [Acidobacteriia bacterium]|nr:class I SAM-dependent methyltransferase [Terriglobia bacterium]
MILSSEHHTEPRPLAHVAVHDTVVKILSKLPRGKVLDVPAGEGALAKRLAAAGFALQCCDLYPEVFSVKDIEVRRGDLSARLPYEPQEFDYVTCIEGLEHIENLHQAVRELRRLLKPNGYLIVSIPNIQNIEERLKWLFFGYTSHFKPISSEYLDRIEGDRFNRKEMFLHIHPIGYSELRYTLENNKFRLIGIFRDKRKGRIWLYWPLAFFICLLVKFFPHQKRSERWTDELQSNEILLGGNTLIVLAVKMQE